MSWVLVFLFLIPLPSTFLFASPPTVLRSSDILYSNMCSLIGISPVFPPWMNEEQNKKTKFSPSNTHQLYSHILTLKLHFDFETEENLWSLHVVFHMLVVVCMVCKLYGFSLTPSQSSYGLRDETLVVVISLCLFSWQKEMFHHSQLLPSFPVPSFFSLEWMGKQREREEKKHIIHSQIMINCVAILRHRNFKM